MVPPADDSPPAPPFPLTEKWVIDCAGWKVVKEARGLLAAGAVSDVRWEGCRLRGTVVAQGKALATGLEIRGRTDLSNLCPCPLSRRHGQICAHATAVALAQVQGLPNPAPAAASPSVPSRAAAAVAAPGPAASPRAETREAVRMVLDPRFAELWAKGKIPVRAEAAGTGPGSQAAWTWLDRAGIRTLPAMCVLRPEQVLDLWEVLADAVPGSVSRGEEAWTVSGTPAARLRVGLEATAEGDYRLTPRSTGTADQVWLRAGERAWAWFPGRGLVQPLRPAPALGQAVYGRLLAGETVTVPPGVLLAALDGWHECLEFLPAPGQGIVVRPAAARFRARFEGSFHALSGIVTVECGEVRYRLGTEPPAGAFPFREAGGAFATRNRAAEGEAAARLAEWGFGGPDGEGQFHLRGEGDVGRFYARGLADLARTWDVELGERFRHVTRDVEIIRPKLVEAKAGRGGGAGENWLGFGVAYAGTTAGAEIGRAEIRTLLEKGQRKVKLPGGRTAFVDLEACAEADEVLYDVHALQEDGLFKVRPAQAGFLRLAFGAGTGSAPRPVTLARLGALQDRLRDYQREGIRWIAGQWTGPAGAGLLADEMGLGKTVQSLAAAEWLLQERGGGQILVVAPTSLLETWRREAAQFLPERRCHVLHGARRWEEDGEIGAADLLVTSYALLVRDIGVLEGREFLAVILDEAGAIKNPDTHTARAARRLRAGARLALTGTPVENGVRELWSIFEFLLPGYLGRREEFRERYEAPVASGAAPKAVLERLRLRVRPVMLRRLKGTVARDLPPKIEQVRACALTPGQAALYESILREARRKIDDALSKKSEGQARMTMLTALLRLRQVCCDPRLLGVEGADKAGSGKLDVFGELLEECAAGGHKVLVFSQFTGMLKLLREGLEERGTSYAYLDGSSVDRAAQVARFQSGAADAPGIFLISLKAGGYGLTLTAADTVIHYDPWWNPAVEAQATDRAHRIGQERPVNAYKLVTTGTVEEKILALQRKKRDVIEAALDDEAPLMQGLSTDELRDVIG
jgi:hypothetical protein